jgi:hypothetical protein
LLAVLPGLLLLPQLRRTGLVVLGLIVATLMMATFVSVTMMGWWFPGRMLMVVYPLFPLVLTMTVMRLHWTPRIFAVPAALYSLLVTGLLVRSEATGEIAIAVNPFDMQAWPFRAVAPLYPQYTAWGADTVLLTILWLGAGSAVIATLAWNDLNRISLRRRAGGSGAATAIPLTES